MCKCTTGPVPSDSVTKVAIEKHANALQLIIFEWLWLIVSVPCAFYIHIVHDNSRCLQQSSPWYCLAFHPNLPSPFPTPSPVNQHLITSHGGPGLPAFSFKSEGTSSTETNFTSGWAATWSHISESEELQGSGTKMERFTLHESLSLWISLQ